MSRFVRYASVTAALAVVLVAPTDGQQRVPMQGTIPVAPTGLTKRPLPDKPVEYDTAEGQNIRVSVVARGIPYPFSLAFLPDGSMLVTERLGRLRIIRNGKLDLSNAYATGIGDFDKFAARFAYAQFPPGANEPQELEKILQEGVAKGMLYIADSDGRPVGSAHPFASVWDNGADAIATLKHEMEVRRIGLRDFGLKNIPLGTPLSELERQLVPLFLHHRYQLVAAAKSLGGVYFTYAVRTAGGPNPGKVAEVVPPDRQRAALTAVLSTLDVDELRIPKRILDLLPPTAFGYGGGTAEFFSGRTGATFDPIGAATIAADITLGALLAPERGARLIQHKSLNAVAPGFDDVVAALIAATWSAPRPADGYGRLIQEAVQSLTATRLMDLAANESASPHVRAIATSGLQRIMSLTAKRTTPHASNARLDIDRFLKRPENPYKRTEPLPLPAGEPIGGRIR